MSKLLEQAKMALEKKGFEVDKDPTYQEPCPERRVYIFAGRKKGAIGMQYSVGLVFFARLKEDEDFTLYDCAERSF